MLSSALRHDIGDRSLRELLGDLSEGTAHLIRQEIQLARTETVETLHALGERATRLAFALALGACAAGAAVTAVILFMSQYVLEGRTWLAALIVAVVLGLVAGWLSKTGTRDFSPLALLPNETTTSIHETAAWLKHPMKSDASSR